MTKGELTGETLRQAKGLAPGQALELTGEDGLEFVLLQLDDFRHILDLAGMSARPTPMERGERQ